jgi:hypothetical protein
MPRTVLNCQGISDRRERVEAAVEAAAQRLAQPFEAWIAADTFRGGVRVLITGPPGFERTVTFALAEAPKRIVRPAARRRMAAAQRKRWAARKAKAAAATTPPPAKAAKRKRRLSREGRTRIVRGDEEAVGGGESTRAEESGGGGGQTGREAHCPDRRRQEFKAGGRAAEDGWPDEWPFWVCSEYQPPEPSSDIRDPWVVRTAGRRFPQCRLGSAAAGSVV